MTSCVVGGSPDPTTLVRVEAGSVERRNSPCSIAVTRGARYVLLVTALWAGLLTRLLSIAVTRGARYVLLLHVEAVAASENLFDRTGEVAELKAWKASTALWAGLLTRLLSIAVTRGARYVLLVTC